MILYNFNGIIHHLQLMGMGYSKEQVLRAYAEALETSPSKDISAVWLAVLCNLREDRFYACSSSTTGASSSGTFSPFIEP